MIEQDATLYALSSGSGLAGVAVIRISGPAVPAVIASMIGRILTPRRAMLATLRDPRNGEILDRGLALSFPGPSSFTGEDMLELHVHGGRAVVDAVLDALGSVEGLEAAAPGAFTRRAFANGKLDLAEVEGLADLIHADTQISRRLALEGALGGLSQQIDGWMRRLVGTLALIEAEIDFSDEADVDGDGIKLAFVKLGDLATEIEAAIVAGAQGERLAEGLSVAIIGPVNAGKSSLLNALASRDAAIVSAHPGTTRDIVEVHLELAGIRVSVADTAGVRESEDEVEREGIARGRRRAGVADLVLSLSAGGKDWVADAEIETWRVATKRDLFDSVPDQAALVVSVFDPPSIAALRERLTDWTRRAAVSAGSATMLRLRQRHAATEAVEALLRAIGTPFGDTELVAEEIRLALYALGRIGGRHGVESMLDALFSEFCIGK